ncbi:MAG: DUF4386 domain-containing protein [Candidatus Limnocylindrales bacterium]
MTRSTRFLTAALLVGAALLANVAFIALGSIFDYPAILERPADQLFEAFRANQLAVASWFVVLALAVGLMTPIALLVGRLSSARPMRMAVVVGLAAAIVQVVGLLRWPLLVPGIADRYGTGGAAAAQAASDFEVANRVLGTVVGETFGYLLTAAWTVLVLAAVGRSIAGRWFVGLGVMAAGMIAVGVLAPLGVPGVGLLNFLGYILWSGWLIAFGIILARGRVGTAVRSAVVHATALT